MTKIYNFDNIKSSQFALENNIILEWEDCVHTEYKSYQFLKEYIKKDSLPLSYIAYPWALLIDYYHKFKSKFNKFSDFINQLNLLEQFRNKNEYSFTVVQSYHFKKYLSDFKSFGIKYIFSPHITKNEFLEIYYKYDLIIYPYYIYPSVTSNLKKKLEKEYLYCFIGNIKYNLDKPSNIRNKLINLNHPKNTYVKKLDEWHFNESVYNNQLNIINSNKSKTDIELNKENRENEYKKYMEKSLYSICPLGIGPNSIRLWESFSYNSIPVSISDDLWLPFYMNTDFKDLILSIKEDDISKVTKLKNIKIDDKYYNFYKNNLSDKTFGSILPIFFNRKRKINLLVPWFNIDENSERFHEIHQCLKKNIENIYINKIYFFYEIENKDNIKFDKYINSKIVIIPVITSKKRDISFNRMVIYANKFLLDDICIISNNDIYFDSTINLINKINFIKNSFFISLTRKNCDKYLDNKNKIWKPHSASQDSWIFLSPIKVMKDEINLGWVQCDNIISESYYSLGYNVINPHYSINSWHLHKHNNTEFLLKNYNYNYKFKMKRIPLESLKDIGNKNFYSNFEFNQNNIDKVNKINVSKLSNLKKKWIKFQDLKKENNYL